MASTIRNIAWGAVIVMVVLFCSCTKYNYIDGGIAYGVHDCTMWEYFHTDSYDWDSTIIMIEHAGLKSLFDGTGEYKQITFFGLTNHSIRRYMLEHNLELEESDPDYYHRVTDIPVEKCRDVLEKLVAPKRYMLDDIPRGNRIQVVADYVENEGMICPCIRGELFLWTYRDKFNNIDDTGVVELYVAGRNQQGSRNEQVASTDIQTTNGVVQALSYDFRFTNF